MKSLIQLISSHFHRVLVETVPVPDGIAEGDEIEMRPLIAVRPFIQPTQTAERWIARIEVTVGPDEGTYFPYKASITMDGVFEFASDFVKDKNEPTLAKVLLINGTSILYGSVRELFAQLTGRFQQGPVPPLASMDFRTYNVGMVEGEKGREAAMAVEG